MEQILSVEGSQHTALVEPPVEQVPFLCGRLAEIFVEKQYLSGEKTLAHQTEQQHLDRLL